MRMAGGIVAIAALAVSSASGVAADQQHLGIDRSEFQARFATAQSRLHHKIFVGPLECGAASIVRSCRGRIGEAIAFNRIETFDKVEDAAAFAAGAPGKLQSVSATLDSHYPIDAHGSLFEDVCAAIAMTFEQKLLPRTAQQRLSDLYQEAIKQGERNAAVATSQLGPFAFAIEVWDSGRGSVTCKVTPST